MREYFKRKYFERRIKIRIHLENRIIFAPIVPATLPQENSVPVRVILRGKSCFSLLIFNHDSRKRGISFIDFPFFYSKNSRFLFRMKIN